MKITSFSKGIYYGRTWGRNREIKQKLVDEYGVCYWCQRKVYIHHVPKGQAPPPDTATLDHLKSRIIGREKGENTPKVLACRACNESRACKERRALKTNHNKQNNDGDTIL